MEAIPTKITNVQQLVEALKNKDQGISYLHIMSSIDIPEREYERFYTWKLSHYTRNCLVKTADFELLLICWEKGQQSSIHDFDSREAWIHPLRGRLTEERFRLKDGRLEKVSSVLLGTSEFSYMTDPIAIHRYTNSYESRSVSLNLYAQPIEKWNEYDEKTGKVVAKNVSYDAVYVFDEEGNIRSY